MLLPPPPKEVGLCDVLGCWVLEDEGLCETLVDPEVAGSLVVPPVEEELEDIDVVLGALSEEELVEGFCEVDEERLETELCVELKDVEIGVDVGSRLVLVELGRLLLEDGIEEELVGRVVICVVVACLWYDAMSQQVLSRMLKRLNHSPHNRDNFDISQSKSSDTLNSSKCGESQSLDSRNEPCLTGDNDDVSR